MCATAPGKSAPADSWPSAGAGSGVSQLSARARAAPESGIVEVINHGWQRPGLIPLWAGEGDRSTPKFICEAAADALAAGETFYTLQRGIVTLRQGLSDYYRRQFAVERPIGDFTVTGSGMHAIKLAAEAVTAPGDELVYLTPAWPNLPAATAVSGAVPVPFPLIENDGGWQLDLNRLEQALTPKTRALFVNSPSNPTGWVATIDELAAVLDLCRRKNVWIIADEIYSRFFYGSERRAPSFLDVAAPSDRVIYVNSFSKNWAMTGWRVGWLVAPEDLGQVFENLVQYSNSGVPQFLQKGAIAAINDGDAFVDQQVAQAEEARSVFTEILRASERVRLRPPDGAFYAFFKIDGITDTRSAALDIVDRANVGLAAGTAFGPGGEQYLRACFLRRTDEVEEAARRIAAYAAAL
ncbi:pyridoxal phosphate-dependent aminotransferase [Pseudohoeflea coraliihabitans]|uniref:Pyridoxal phosphate-dependent aminotransferase n=1 Tax=Pseudohoeflea coraliihabitans TaxID=2860393 RepID=A0ABS6WNA3_9HYPH|nr:pyridoxal phosphate-dependent aminotransferase [Pseudohoeflea sp. DP4N28-3]MBW3097442.1 pyridoxal phosphate-dependent aminotransferase [Pseudohoeflea sp. DP4N28-3]